jgi:hypothetical protein
MKGKVGGGSSRVVPALGFRPSIPLGRHLTTTQILEKMMLFVVFNRNLVLLARKVDGHHTTPNAAVGRHIQNQYSSKYLIL